MKLLWIHRMTVCPISDIYISVVSDTHKVASKGKYVAMVSTRVETLCPQDELEPALELLGEIDEKFVFVNDMFEPVDDGSDSKVKYSVCPCRFI